MCHVPMHAHVRSCVYHVCPCANVCSCVCICMLCISVYMHVCPDVLVFLCVSVCMCICVPSSFTQITAQCIHLGSEGLVPSRSLGTVRPVTEAGALTPTVWHQNLHPSPGAGFTLRTSPKRRSHHCELQTLSLEYFSQISFWIKLALFYLRTMALSGLGCTSLSPFPRCRPSCHGQDPSRPSVAVTPLAMLSTPSQLPDTRAPSTTLATTQQTLHLSVRRLRTEEHLTNHPGAEPGSAPSGETRLLGPGTLDFPPPNDR